MAIRPAVFAWWGNRKRKTQFYLYRFCSTCLLSISHYSEDWDCIIRSVFHHIPVSEQSGWILWMICYTVWDPMSIRIVLWDPKLIRICGRACSDLRIYMWKPGDRRASKQNSVISLLVHSLNLWKEILWVEKKDCIYFKLIGPLSEILKYNTTRSEKHIS